MKTAVGIDVGGTHARVGLVGAEGRLVSFRRERTPRDADGTALLAWLGKTAAELVAGRPEGLETPECAGWASPGVLNPEKTQLIRAVNLEFLQGRPIRDELMSRLGIPVMLESDAAAAAWGEFGAAGQPRARFVYLTIGTGVGATVILDGEIVRHTRNTAGQLGHLVVDSRADAASCRCGARGCLEAVVSGPVLERAAAALHLPESLTELEAAYREGHVQAGRILDDACRHLGAALVSIAHVYAPDLIVLGGGVMTALPALFEGAQRVFEELSGDLVPSTTEVRAAKIGDHAGTIGVAQLARRYFGLASWPDAVKLDAADPGHRNQREL
jgi:glucokinase